MESLLKVTAGKWNMQSEEGGRGTEGAGGGRQRWIAASFDFSWMRRPGVWGGRGVQTSETRLW